MEQPDDKKLKAAIDRAIQSADDRSPAAIVSIVLTTQSDLIQVLIPFWVSAAVETMVRARLRRIETANSKSSPDQMSFPFRDLSARIPISKGFVELRTATLGQLRQCERVLTERLKEKVKEPRPNSLLGKVQRQIELMEPYVHANRKLTVENVQEMIASGVPAPSRRRGMSEAMKRYWDAKTPAERSAIARRRSAARAKKAAKKKGS